MNVVDCFKMHWSGSAWVAQTYLADLTDSELLVRAVPGSNHIAWQIGHCLLAEHGLMESLKPGSMPKLPEGFAERYTSSTAKLDSASAFHTKATYVELMESLRNAAIKVLEAFPVAELEDPSVPPWSGFLPTKAAMFRCVGEHWLMHTGQWALVRRKLGRAPLF